MVCMQEDTLDKDKIVHCDTSEILLNSRTFLKTIEY